MRRLRSVTQWWAPLIGAMPCVTRQSCVPYSATRMSPEMIGGRVTADEPQPPPDAAEVIARMQAQPKPDVTNQAKVGEGSALRTRTHPVHNAHS